MIERICSHCGTALLVGLEYCPGCLRAIESRREPTPEKVEPVRIADRKDEPTSTLEYMLSDLQIAWSNFVYPLKSTLCVLLGWPQPEAPPDNQASSSQADARFAFREPNQPASLYLTPGYTRVVCPTCNQVQRAPLDLSPSVLMVCEACKHPFHGSFAAEFRKGADLMCFRCGVTSFCVSGLSVTTCPNCHFSEQQVKPKRRIKPKVWAVLASPVLVLAIAFAFSVATKTTSHFLVGFCVACVGSALGFVTLVALGV